MTRSILATTTAIATLVTTSFAFAAENAASDLQGNSPAVTEGGNANVVGSTPTSGDLASKRFGIGESEYDPTRMAMTQQQYDALNAAIGAEFKTSDGKVLGMIEDVTIDGQGNPNLEVDLNDDTKIDADNLVITLLPDSIVLKEGKIFIDTSEDNLYLQAQDGSKADDESRTTVIVM
ncbi:hypothetical protein HKX54_05910 [Sulfitobacter sp. M57]|uniref:PRC-barrel domain-containing protein n=1 Tax=unclassified Sulfitobacter TaxID=196795 RepID=UPI0023E1D9D5|nr:MULTISPECIES: PRC-barrel domain-containing protein [unclassified Sulfitobacter]MDF3413981.1 hypothetical protein [Sulfitobacter sp. KE5]MDF3420738.1 hypothetical protein [Sulfitobacter sp. KE43]MDF3432527.1 hypothetical protein [Sulfitobacter sp. KE42]MDF3458166.1 hypothetical protein [Sulfitobacter sp. S74]MDF3462067.1 hypothetical protein [Sulfitobacter sp. Ks18]